MSNDRSYLLKRAAQERSAAAQATGEPARDAHHELERRYRELAETECVSH